MATKICRRKKTHWLENRIKAIEKPQRRNETRKFFKDIKTFRRTEQAGTLLLCKDDKGNILTEKQQVLERWKRYFNPLNPELNPICYLLALLAHHFLHVSTIRVKSLTLWLLMSYIYIYIYIYIWSAYS